MYQNSTLLQSMIDIWTQWQKRPNEAVTSKRNLTKILGVVGALYAYNKLTPNTKNDKPFAALFGTAALLGLVVPSKDEIDIRYKDFYQRLSKGLISESIENMNLILDWINSFPKEQQCVISEFFHDERIEEVINFLKNSENRQKTTDLIKNSNQFFSDDSLKSIFSFDLKPTVRNYMTIDKGAVMTGVGFGEILLGKNMKGRINNPYIEILSQSGILKIPTNKIIRINIISKVFWGLKASIDTINGSSYKGDLITSKIDIVFDDGAISENGLKMKQLTKIEGKEIIDNTKPSNR